MALCEPQILQRCPTQEKRESYLKTAEAFSAGGCSIDPSYCIALVEPALLNEIKNAQEVTFKRPYRLLPVLQVFTLAAW